MRSSMSVKKRIGTHNGTFHCSEALACYIVRQTNNFKGAEIVRTRDQTVLDTLDVLLDVGAAFNPTTNRFDHHQRGFNQTFGRGFVTRLSCAGLVYKYFGLEIVAREMGMPFDHPDVDLVYVSLYRNFIEAIDAIENGISQYDGFDPPKYIDDTNLSTRVVRMNPDWLEDQCPEKENAAFLRAVELAGKEFMEVLHYHITSWLPARWIVNNCIAARFEADSSGEIIVLKTFCPWKLHLFVLEKELKVSPPIKFVLYKDNRSVQWRVQAVPVSHGRFECRKALPVSWRGLSDEELCKEAGIDNCIFVHMSGFVGGNKTLDGAFLMAKKALTMY